MAIEYRDYGSIGGNSSIELYGQQVQKPTTQVYKATHIGELRLPYMNRSFISFSYGGKNIEDFNLIAYNKNDQMSRDLYASFVDTTTDKIAASEIKIPASIAKTIVFNILLLILDSAVFK